MPGCPSRNLQDSGALHEIARDALHAGGSHRTHGDLKFRLEDLKAALDPGLTERRKPPYVRSADANRRGPESQRLENVGPAAKAAVNQDWHLAADRLNHLGK